MPINTNLNLKTTTMRKIFILLILLLVTAGADAQTRKRTTPKRNNVIQRLQTPEQKLLGHHLLSLQWISWEYFGGCDITKDEDGTLRCVGEQLSRENDDYLRLNGTISIVDATHFVFTGTIAMKIYHINGGEECLREGTFDFKATGKRRYWRLQQMTNPCDECTDYVDIYFKR